MAVKYVKEIKKLTKYLHNKGYKVVFAGSDVLHDYAGTNPEFTASTGFPSPGKKTFAISKSQNKKTQLRNLRHEIIEFHLMKAGVQYGPAHVTALKLEGASLSPSEIDVLAKIGNYDVVHVHDDGDLTVSSKGKMFVVTTGGQLFEKKQPNFSKQPRFPDITNKIAKRLSGDSMPNTLRGRC